MVSEPQDEHERLRATLQHNTERLQAVLDAAVDGILVIDDVGIVQTVNPAACRLFGYSADEILGRNVKMLMPPPWREEHDGYLARYMATGEARIIGIGREVKGRRRDGTAFPIDLAVAEIRYGAERYFLGTVRDLTQRKLLEDELRQAQKMEAVGRLAGGVAHDFNTLLGTVSGYSEMLLETLPPASEPRRMVEQIHQAAQRGARLTRQLLAFSRREEIRLQDVHPVDVLEEIGDMIERLIGEDVELARRYGRHAGDAAGEVGVVRCDPGHLQQVVLNLVVNACDAMPRGGRLSIGLDAARLDQGALVEGGRLGAGEYVVLEVRDTGVGMDEATRQRIFEPFFTTKEPGKGTGLGLATVYGIVRHSGGGIAVESAPGEGSRFRVFLPRAGSGAPAVAVPALAPAPASAAAATRGGAERLLVVEDDPMFQGLIREVLQKHGYAVRVAGSPAEALELLEADREPVDLLLSDMVMPGGTGVDLATALRPRYAGLKVILMSGYTDDALATREADPTTADAFLEKPFATAELLRRVREILDT